MSGRSAVALFFVVAALAILWGAGAAASGAGLGPRAAGPSPLLPRGRAEWRQAEGVDRAPALLPQDWVGRPPVSRPVRAWERAKSGRVALVSSLLVPGLGQLYNEREFWAAVAAGVEHYFIGSIVVEQRLTLRNRALSHRYQALRDDFQRRMDEECAADPSSPECAEARDSYEEARDLFMLYRARFEVHRDNRIQSTWLLGLSMLISGLQSFVDAHLFDFDESPPLQLEAAGPKHGAGAALRLRF